VTETSGPLAAADATGRFQLITRILAHPLGAFLGLAFGLSWGVGWVARGEPTGTLSPLFPAGVALAALTVTAATQGRPGLSRLGRRVLAWRFAFRWYTAAIGLPVVVTGAAVAANPLLGGTPPDWSTAPPPATLLVLLLIFLLVPVAAPLAEEIGWRGVALPRLLDRHSPLTAALILGTVWSLWHVPAVVADPSIRPPVPFLLSLLPTSVVLTWLSRGTGGSIAVAVLHHACTDLTLVYSAGLTRITDATRLFWLLTLSQTIVASLIILTDRARWLTPPPPKPSEGGDHDPEDRH
jgi:membrane protease YdiL (CAAX protease family)